MVKIRNAARKPYVRSSVTSGANGLRTGNSFEPGMITEPSKVAPGTESKGLDWQGQLLAFLKTPEGILSVFLTAVIASAFWPLLSYLPTIWSGQDGYYSHGFLVPVIVGYIIYRRWPDIKSIPVRPGWFALVPLLATLVLMRAGFVASMWFVMSACFILTLLFGIWLVAGIRWMWALFFPVAYTAFALPLFGSTIEQYSNPLQQISTTAAYELLKAMGMDMYRDAGNTTIYLNRFILDVGVPCSGLKLILALTAFTTFFILIARLKWWANVVLALIVLPLAVFINGLRIALIGVVGETYGSDAGHTFHDWSGYLTLLLCFFILFKFARLLGWKD